MKKPPKPVKAAKTTTARVSVIVPVFNHEAYVEEAVMSALSQSTAIFELIAIDDGSTDRSLQRLRTLAQKDDRVKVYTQPNRGASATINHGLALARGEWLAILNSDDRWVTHRLKRLIAIASRDNAQVLFSRCTPIDEQGNNLPETHHWVTMYQQLMHQVDTRGLQASLCTGNPVISTSNFFFHRSALECVGMLRHRRFVADWDWALRAVLRDDLKASWCDESLLEYRLHNTNTIHQSGLRSSIEIAYTFSSMQMQFPKYVQALEPQRRKFTHDVIHHITLKAYAKGQTESDSRNLSERRQASTYIDSLETTLRQERAQAHESRQVLIQERDQARQAQQQAHLDREHDIAELRSALDKASRQRDEDLALVRDGYEKTLKQLELLLHEERHRHASIRTALEAERDEARAAQQASHESRERDLAELRHALTTAALQRDNDLAATRDAYESELSKLGALLSDERERSASVRSALEVERDEARAAYRTIHDTREQDHVSFQAALKSQELRYREALNDTIVELEKSRATLATIALELEQTQRALKFERESTLSYRFRKLWIR